MSANDIEKEKRFTDFTHSRVFLMCFAIVMSVCFLIGWIVLVKNENRIIEIDTDYIQR